MGRSLAFIRLPLNMVLNEIAREKVYFGTHRIREMLIMNCITVPQDRLDDLIMHYKRIKKGNL